MKEYPQSVNVTIPEKEFKAGYVLTDSELSFSTSS